MGFYSSFKAISEIETTRGTNAKKDLVAKYSDDENVKNLFIFLFDNQVITGIREKKWEKVGAGNESSFTDVNGFISFIKDHNTGKDSDIASIKQSFIQIEKNEKAFEGHNFHTDLFWDCVKKLVTKTWTIGIDEKSINEVIPGLIDTFEVMLCKKYYDDPEYWDNKTFALQVKLDGFRFVLIKQNGNVRTFARSGKETTGKFPEIENEAKLLKADNFVLDGERMPLGFMKMDNKQQFKLVASSQKKEEQTGFCLAIYDWMPVNDWKKQHTNIFYSERYAEYMSLFKNCKYLFPLPACYIGSDVSQIKKWFDWAIANGKEGLIIKNVDAPYEWDRSEDCVKLKTIFDIDLEVIGFEEGKGKLKGSLGALLLKYGDNVVKCGSGLTEEGRKEIWSNQKRYLNKILEITYMEKSCDKFGNESLRHPIFKCFKNNNTN